ncbi:MAG TPA: ABC transporter ATP-binding protein, partial [Casimicrobiaceae bacterium]|nr:ABC transporter ATP-binding protein [Casimicrobiaceae bacterium]
PSSAEGAGIRVSNVEHYYESEQGHTVQALQPTSLDIEPGEFVAIVGPSGCGKTTLLSLVGGLVRPTRGEILIGSRMPQVGAPDLGYLFARDGLLPWRTAAGNVGLPLELRGMDRKEREARVAATLAVVGLKDFADSHPAQLSQGMRQRVALARMLVTEPTTLLMDEPFSALDAQTRLLMHLHFLAIWERHKSTVLLITHDLGEAITLADRVIVFSRRPGRIKGEYRVDIPRPRRVADLQANAHYHDLFRKIWEILEEELVGGGEEHWQAGARK